MAAASSLTFKEIQDFLLTQLQELQAPIDMTLPKIKAWINMGYKDFVRRTRAFTNDYDVTTVADQESYSIKAGAFYHVSGGRYIEDSSTEYGIPLRLWPGGFDNLPRHKVFGTPYHIWVRYAGDNVAVEMGTVPIADTADYTVKVFGYNLPTKLTSDSQIPVIHEAYHEALIQYPLWKICNAYAHKSKAIREKGVIARQEYLDIVNDGKRDMEDFLSEDSATIDVYSGHFEDF